MTERNRPVREEGSKRRKEGNKKTRTKNDLFQFLEVLCKLQLEWTALQVSFKADRTNSDMSEGIQMRFPERE